MRSQRAFEAIRTAAADLNRDPDRGELLPPGSGGARHTRLQGAPEAQGHGAPGGRLQLSSLLACHYRDEDGKPALPQGLGGGPGGRARRFRPDLRSSILLCSLSLTRFEGLW